MDDFDQLASSPAAVAALQRLRAVTGATSGPMERHCLRVRQIAAEIARQRGWSCDAELLTIAAILHDIGLYPGASRGGVYTADGAALARELLQAQGWESARIERCAAAIDRHHDLRSQLSRGTEVEAVRLADLVDLSRGLLRFGLDRRWLRACRREIPRAGFEAELARALGRALRERPTTLPRIFLRG